MVHIDSPYCSAYHLPQAGRRIYRRVEWFLKKTIRKAVPNCLRTPNPKYFFEMLIINLLLGLRKFDCYPKIGFKNNIFEGCAMSKTNLPYWGHKNKTIFFFFGGGRFFFEVKERYLQISPKIFICQGPCVFLKVKT